MNLTTRDRIATVLVGAATLVYGLWIIGMMAGLATEAVAAIVLVLGVLASASAVVPGFASLISGSKAYLATASLLGVVALGSGILTIMDGTATTLAVLVLCTLAMWGLATARHAASGESQGASLA